jgi:predicted nucleotidyltransferase
VVTHQFNADSDIDFLIAFKDNLSVDEYTDNYFLLHEGLRKLFRKKIDLVTERTLTNPYLIQSINESKRLMYEA